MVGKVTVSRDLRQGHHSIRRLLEQDDERRGKQKKSSYISSFDKELFSSQFEKRRLRLINAIFQSLGRCGVRATLRGKDPDSFDFKVGEQHLSFSLDHPGIRRFGSRYGGEAMRPATLPLHLEIKAGNKAEQLQYIWKDEPNKKLERQITDIVVTMITAGELHYRLYEFAQREWLIKYKADLIEHTKQKIEEERQRQEEERRRRDQARIDRLLGEAAALQQAETIRSYVANAREYNKRLPHPLTDSKFDNWAQHALAQADSIDPILSGNFLSVEPGK
jgi:hypothetical protein